MKNVAFHNLGCKVNSYELDVVQQNFVKRGYKIVPFDQMADIYVINTCTVTNIADRKSRQMIHRARKQNPLAIVVALGCYVQTGKEKDGLDADIDIAIGNNKKKDTVKIVEEYLQKHHGAGGMIRDGHEAGRAQETLRRAKAACKTERNILDIAHTCEYEEMTLEQTVEHPGRISRFRTAATSFVPIASFPLRGGGCVPDPGRISAKRLRGWQKKGAVNLC